MDKATFPEGVAAMTFIPNRRFRREYDHLFRCDPATANLHLLLCELSDRSGAVNLGANPEVELAKLMLARFEDPKAYQLPREPKR